MTKKPAKRKSQKKESSKPADAPFRADPVLCFLAREGGATELWGMTLRQRLEKQFAREGVTDAISPEEVAGHNGPVILVREDCVIDPPLIPAIVKRPDFVLLSDMTGDDCPIAVHARGAGAAAGLKAMEEGVALDDKLDLFVRRPADLNAVFWDKLRKREVPYARAVSASNKDEVEWRIFMGTYKGATDLVTKYVWPRPAFYVTRWLAPTFVTPNQVTALSAVCVVLAFWLFWEGAYIAGLISAWMMTFLDTVDGKLARTTLTSSKWGDIFDHGIDLVHPPFWYVAWALGLAIVNLAWTPDVLAIVLGAIIGGYILQRIMEGIAIALLGLEIHIWRPVDTFFRLITARRNPNLLIMTVITVLTGRPDLALELVAWWTVICLVLHGIQLAHALIVRARTGKLTSWMAKPVSAGPS
ncbi:MAG: CDP-alcohol phosphatidyltransferase family protein [Pseudomonadota bacterium]